MRACRPKKLKEERESVRVRQGGREGSPWPFAPLFMFFLFPRAWASQECCLFYLRSSLWSWDLPLSYFHRLFPCLLATTILDSLFLF